jgi:predicted transposase YdaD
MRGGQAELEVGAQRLGAVSDERRQQELSLHFLVLGGLRYNREDLLDLIGRKGMIPLDQLRESSFYQLIAEEGLKEGREQGLQQGKAEEAAEILRLLIAKRFPKLDVASEIGRIRDVTFLQQLCLEVVDLPDAAALQRRLAEILESEAEHPEPGA